MAATRNASARALGNPSATTLVEACDGRLLRIRADHQSNCLMVIDADDRMILLERKVFFVLPGDSQ